MLTPGALLERKVGLAVAKLNAGCGQGERIAARGPCNLLPSFCAERSGVAELTPRRGAIAG